MKKTISLVLAIVFVAALLLSTLTGCNRFDPQFTGPELHMSLPGRPLSFDPMHAFRCVSGATIVSMVFEGLMVHDENGRIRNGVKQSYRVTRENLELGEFVIEITLRESRWSTGTRVQASDFIFAWHRIIDPANNSEAAPLLFQIQNAMRVNSRYEFYDRYDFGAAALGEDIIEVIFEVEPGGERPDLDMFWQAMASPALVPLNRDDVERHPLWYSISLFVSTNGPFAISEFSMIIDEIGRGNTLAETISLRRNPMYRRNLERHALDRYVTPSRIVINLNHNGLFAIPSNGGVEERRLNAGSTLELNQMLWNYGVHSYTSAVPFDQRNAADVRTQNTLNTHTYIFNTDNPLFADARVRQALSVAIDRQALIQTAEIHAVPAAGFVPEGNIFNTTQRNGTSFRTASGQLIDATGDTAEARRLLNAAGVTSGSFDITVRQWDTQGYAVARAVAAVWRDLGFTVGIRRLGARRIDDAVAEIDALGEDLFMIAYQERDFDVIAIDLEALSTNPLFVLAQFVPLYSGARESEDEVRNHLHSSGFDSAEISELLTTAFRTPNPERRAEILHQIEEMLVEAMPAMPLVVHQNVYRYNSNMTNIRTNWNGSTNFVRTGDRSWSPD